MDFRRTKRNAAFSIAQMVSCAFTFALLLAGCGGQPSEDAAPPLFVGTNYAAVATNTSTQGLPQAGTLALFYYPDGPKGSSSLIWPYLTTPNELVFDKLIVFNGGLSQEMSWKYFPALLAYTGRGNVVEISMPACRQIPGREADWTNYAFSVLAMSNDIVRLDASQSGTVFLNRPRRLEVDLSKADILKAIAAAQSNPDWHEFGGVKYLIAP